MITLAPQRRPETWLPPATLASAVLLGMFAVGQTSRARARTVRASDAGGDGSSPSGVCGCGTKGPTPTMSRSSAANIWMSSARLASDWPGSPTIPPPPIS